MISIIGCGNTNRSDDGVGCYVARQLQARFNAGCPEVKVFDAGTDGMEVMFRARGSKQLIIVDASSTHSAPGSIYEVPGEILQNDDPPSYNLHNFRWEHAIYAGKKIYKEDFPENVTVFLIEAESTDFGLGISERVKIAAEQVVEKIVKKVSVKAR